MIVRTYRRSMVSVGVIVVLTVALFVIHLGYGQYPMSISRVLATLTGDGGTAENFAVYSLRLPRALTAVLAGAAFGASGAVYQSVTRNPLGSPDIIGFTYGASFGAVFAIAILSASDATVTAAALAGGMGVAALVYVLAYRGGVQGYRLILVGIGISAVLESCVSYLIARANITDSAKAFTWLTGSLNGRTWFDVWVSLVGIAVLGPMLIGLGPGLRMSELGDDTARGLGVPVARNRMLALLGGALLCAMAVVSVGPITFVSLSAPQIARRLTGSPNVAVVPSMAMGAFLLIGSDLLAQVLFPNTQLPVGVATLALGGAYLAWLIAHDGRSRIG
jgi:iron complex transport system permease protein